MVELQRNALALFAHQAELDQPADDARVAVRVCGVSLLELVHRYRRWRRAGALDLQAVVEQPHLDPAARDAVVPVSNRIHECFRPDERRVVGHLPKEQIVEPRRLLDQRIEQRARIANHTREVALDSRELLNVVLRTRQSLVAGNAKHPHTGARVLDRLDLTCEQEDRRISQRQTRHAAICESTAHEVVLERELRETRRIAHLRDQVAVECRDRHL